MADNDVKIAGTAKAVTAPSSKPEAKAAPQKASAAPVDAPKPAAKPVVPFVNAEAAKVALPTPVAKAAPTPAKPAPAKPLSSKPVQPARKPAAKKPVVPAKKPAVAAAPVAAPQPAVPTSVAAPAVKESIMDNTTETVTNKAQAMFADASARTKGAVEKSQQLFAEANEFAKGNIEAMIESSKIAAKGAEDIARYSTDYARQTVAKANETARQFAAVKSPTEFFQLQSEIARSTVDAMATETAKFTENYLKLMGDVVQPLSNRFALAAEKVKVAA